MIIMFCCFLCVGCGSQAEGEIENTTDAEESTLTEAVDDDKPNVGEEKDFVDISENADKNEDEEIDEKVESYIEAYVNLSEDSEVEKYEWMEYDNEQVLHIAVRYKEPPENDYWHKEDYFLFITQDENVSQILYVDYENKGIDVGVINGAEECTNDHSLGWGCSFDAHFEDVTFDNHKDLLIAVGDSKHASYYCVYVYKDGEFHYEKTFEHIPNYKIDTNKEVIYGSDTDGMGMYYDTTYEYRNGEFLLIEKNEYSVIE